MLQQIAVTTAPNWQSAVALTVDGATLVLNLAIHYNEVAHYPVLSVSDVNDNLLVDSVPMITGNYPACNILKQQAYLGIGSAYLINVTGTPGGNPDNTNLGTGYLLWWGDSPGYQA